MKNKKNIIGILALGLSLSTYGQHAQQYISIPEQTAKASTTFTMGTATNPSGRTIHLDGQSMLFDNVPKIPVMGEIHFSRLPAKEWKRELLKMKAGGINIAATYIFWIHHEEREGQLNWAGQRNLRQFIAICKEVDMPLILRIGPWCHGEVRNGGIPEWMIDSGFKLRNSNDDYLSKVRTWFGHIYAQASGYQWKDGGPIVGIQIENEYRGAGEHLVTLKKITQDIGFDVPLYTRTGWPALSRPIPFGEIIPLYGDYADGFWDRSTKEMPGDYWKSYIFRPHRSSTVIATEMLPTQSGKDNASDLEYPYFTCELGGGMMTSYHRRIQIQPMDIYSMALVKVGSGSNLPGYYMYHGGTNPDGQLTTLSEMQNSKLTNHNDLPVKSYDFQAPLGEYGQVNPQYHLLRKLHIFLQDFGTELASMPAYFPERPGTEQKQDSLLRWSVRTDGTGGYVFVNNYRRLANLEIKHGVQFHIQLPDRQVIFPETPIDIEAGASFFMPFDRQLGAAHMVYATAQPLAHLKQQGEHVYVFEKNQGVPATFVFTAGNLLVESSSTTQHTKNGQIYFSDVPTGTDAVITLQEKSSGQKVKIILLDKTQAASLWKGTIGSKDYLFLSNANLTYPDNKLELTGQVQKPMVVSIYPAPQSLLHAGHTIKAQKDGLFTRYSIPVAKSTKTKIKPIKTKNEALPLRTIQNGRAGVAEQPSDKDFEKAAEWTLELPKSIPSNRDLLLKFRYTGDVARIYLDGKLVSDNFYNGTPLLLGLQRLGTAAYGKKLIVKILPLPKETPGIYLPTRTDTGSGKQADYFLSLDKVEIQEEHTALLELVP